ncbi:hypothetical protein, partial [Methylobacterium sp. 37f]|uniref:hypothetical protein n=1 Tax=Methylobacterium sp. 37f TaxID=2817058 RepID=UPI001FFD5045
MAGSKNRLEIVATVGRDAFVRIVNGDGASGCIVGQHHTLDAHVLIGPKVHRGRGGARSNADFGPSGIVD